MTFPDTLLIEFLYWLINTPGVGGAAVGFLAISITVSVTLVFRWISKGADVEDEPETYAYPTPALHHHD
ncbi:MAG: hypothetical protein HN736_11475 [Anaerolineae bacterium]|jgi:hypothetical protein|nr:hypothetical protein [Anaerolineae bacterium]MBT3714806.1 hypothetical protein [Anaerolineae bacterium]MBT4309708.1 hypothetical protein [Anaerolineae bacterium]MBT4456901.1 hypothetical protein [Anaerolineae bacterium]MBT4843749.1 hypothetical protein [Anaerolineae bacterium]